MYQRNVFVLKLKYKIKNESDATFQSLLKIATHFKVVYYNPHPRYFRPLERTRFKNSWLDQTHSITFEV